MNSRWSLDNFDIELTKTDEGVLIKAEDQLQGNLYSKLLDHESIKNISIDPFFDLETLYQLLKDYFEKKSENTSLSLSNSGKLNYSCQVLFGPIVKKFEFDLQLEKQELDDLVKLENQVNKLTKALKVENEKTLSLSNGFQNFEKTILERLGKIEEILARTETRMTRLEEKISGEILQCEFNLTPELKTKFQVENNSKTALSLTNTHTSIFAKQSLPKSKKTKFSLLIGKSNWIMVGIVTEKYFQDHAYRDPAGFGYSHDGGFWTGGTKQGNYPPYKEGDQLSFTCNMSTGKIKVFLNDYLVGIHILSKENRDSNIYYPFLYAESCVGLGATFI